VAAEVEAIRRLVSCVRGAGPGARAHVVHVSGAEGLAEVHAARERGLAVTAETCPHYLAFTEADFERVGPALKCAPPIRDAASRERLWAALLAGRVDLVGSDHSPCPAADKHKGEHDVWQAWGGVAGIQATLPVLLTEGVHRGLSLERVADLTASAPARLFGLYPRKGAIVVNADADFALVDPHRTWTFGPEQLHTKSGISPYLGRTFRGAVVRTIVRGRTVFADGQVVGTPGWGTLLRRDAKHAN
jgi:allantoinase